MFPETAGKSLEEVEDMFLDPKGLKYIGTPAWRTGVVRRGLRSDAANMEKVHGMGGVVEEEDNAVRPSGTTARISDEEAAMVPVVRNE